PDGRPVNVARPRGHLFVCASGCCCGRTEDGFAPAPIETFHREWEQRRLRNVVHLTIGGGLRPRAPPHPAPLLLHPPAPRLAPCALPTWARPLSDGQAQCSPSVTPAAIAPHTSAPAEAMLEPAPSLPPPAALRPYHFTASAWQARPDGQPVDDYRPRRAAGQHGCAATPSGIAAAGADWSVERVVAAMAGEAALPRKNGELGFEEPWQRPVL